MNFILIISDTLRRDHLGCYGNEWISTPHIDRFARKSVVNTGRKVVPRRLRPAFNPLRMFLRRVLNKYDKSVEEQNRLGWMIGPLGYWEEMQDYQINLLKQLGLQPHHALLDIGCGPLSGGLAFIPYLDAGCYFGVDIRESAIEEAHKQVAKAGLLPHHRSGPTTARQGFSDGAAADTANPSKNRDLHGFRLR